MSIGKKTVGVSGEIWLRKKGEFFLGDDRIGLLEMIGKHGSITKAARAAGISYRTAWDMVDALENLSEEPFVRRTTGGRGGGGSILTGKGREIVRRYRILQKEHRRFVGGLSAKIGNVDEFYRFLRRIAVKVSARNAFQGKVVRVKPGAVNSEVTLSLKGGDRIVSVITKKSVENLGLKKGSEAWAIVKASSVMLGRDLHDARISARNILCGTVEKVVEGKVNDEVTVRLSGGSLLTSIITRESVRRLALEPGDHACAVIKASSVILGVAG